jgi:uncharacterized membrane protein YedE/YeeE
MFDTPERLAFGLLTGLLFGFLLQKGQVTKFRTIVGQFLLKDFTVLKVMLTAVVVGGVGVAVLVGAGHAAFHIKPLVLGGIIAGGLLFGVGMAVLGYCPGTGVAAIAEGSRHAIFGVLGMLFGAAVYAEAYPAIKATLLTWGDYGKQTLPTATGASHGVLLAVIGLGAAALFVALEWFERRRQNTTHDTAVGADRATA